MKIQIKENLVCVECFAKKDGIKSAEKMAGDPGNMDAIVFFITLILLFQFLIFIPGFIWMGKEEKEDNGEDEFEFFHFIVNLCNWFKINKSEKINKIIITDGFPELINIFVINIFNIISFTI
jgi:hypothetical protein